MDRLNWAFAVRMRPYTFSHGVAQIYIYWKANLTSIKSATIPIRWYATDLCHHKLYGFRPLRRSYQLQTFVAWISNTTLEEVSRSMRKHTFWHVRLAETQISRRMHTVWSESSLSAWRNFASLAIQNASSEDSDQTVWMRRLIWSFAGRICPMLRFLTLRLK